jgi:aspartyl/asparaginyl beta-hydroxylase (cupin superfamily)
MSTDFRAEAEAGVEALRRGDARAARDAFDRIETAGQGTHQLRLLLAQACMMSGDAGAAHRALDKVLAEEPTNLYALVMRGDLLVGAGDDRAAVSWYQAALAQAPRAGPLPQDLIDTLRRVEAEVARTGGAFAAQLDSSLIAAGISAPEAGRRFAESLDLLMGRAEVQLQEPTSFYYPQLPQRPFFEREDFAWVHALEAAAPAIRAELEAMLASESGLVPYVAADPDRPAKRHALLDDPRWSAFHLYHRGAPVSQNASRCPATMAALAEIPLPRIEGRAPIAMFSVLRAGTHIPPHNGMLNTRLICHLPIVAPQGCRLRVGNETRPVEQDRTMVFDDTIEHEAWNDGDSTRVILLFEIWRPELDGKERAALTALFAAIDAYAPAEQDQAGA